MQLSFSISQIEQAAKLVIDHLGQATIIAMHGQMGAGKTTLAGALCRLLGAVDPAGSPTFSLINQYNTSAGAKIYHMDWYRLSGEEEAIDAGIEDALYSGNICLVEWPGIAASLLPDDTLHIYLEVINDIERMISLPGIN